MEMSHRTRYDLNLLGPMAVPMLKLQYQDVVQFCASLNGTRPDISTQQP
jgi:hypothetical protein